ncbi:MAG: Asp-tRNA(Asn)/Glu-tRNA(Gln) amidotransferase subunit GatA [Bdellovibrionaceae bacterium]|nr:Asp-tRNA(Asn)/Glu-tRNA(Gln) amidotransferase subunit GatA [Pseudobdellovibrionaceae bacterium]
MEIYKLSAVEIANRIKKGELSAEEVTQHFLKRCQVLNPKLNALITISENAIEEAKKIDKKDKSSLPLAGVPILLKDMFCTKGIKTTAASKILKDFIPPYDSTVTKKLKEAGGIILGKCNQDEFAMGSSNETSFFGATKNPWNLNYVPGGSSGGSAASVAARMAPLSIGTDTGGSIRQPANFCGVFGIKPTYGRISRYGIVAFASSFDQAGPISMRVQDSALALEILCGKDPLDSTTTSLTVPSFSKNLTHRKLRIGKIKSFFNEKISPEIMDKINEAIKKLEAQGHSLVEIEIEHLELAVDTYYLLAMSEASSNLSRYDGVRYGYRADFRGNPPSNLEEFYSRTRSEGFGEEVKRRIALGTYSLSSGYYEAYYLQAAKVRRLIQESFQRALTQVDVLISPVTTTTAFQLGEKLDDPLAMYFNDVFTTCVNLAGLPAASLPIGFDSKGLPIGLQIIGDFFQEEKILSFAHDLEEEFKCYMEEPDVI